MKKLLLILLCLPMIGFGQDDDNTYLHVFLQGQIVLSEDGKEIYLETQDCAYAGKYYFGAIANENTGDRKIDKKAKKNNKQKNKKIEEYIKRASKAPNGIMVNMEVEAIIGDLNGKKTIHPLKIINPIKPPVKTGSSRTIDDYTQLCYEIYLRTQEIKKRCRFLYYANVTDPNDELNTIQIFWDQNCVEIDTLNLTLMQAEAEKISNEVSDLKAEGTVALNLLIHKMNKLQFKKQKGTDVMTQIKEMQQLTMATLMQVRFNSDNEMIQEMIKESKTILKYLSLKKQ